MYLQNGGVVPGEIVGLILLLAWMSFGVLLALVMGRRGHAPAAWGVLGMMLGPLAVPIALDVARRHRRPAVKTLAAGEPVREGIAVLAGIDGSEEAVLALRRAVTLLGSRIGRLAVVTVLPYDAEDDPVVLESDQTRARLWMSAAREAAPGVAAEEYLVTGRPAKVLADLAESDDFDVIVVGARGRGMSPRLFGSVAGALAHSSPVPVLIGGRREATPAPRLRAV
jgi:nucleotide-binding universal stress UspA family protein